MKNAKVSFFPIDGSGVLHIDFAKGPFPDATEAIKGDGIGFFDSKNNLMGVTFDDVKVDGDVQSLTFKGFVIEVKSKKGKISYSITTISKKKPAA